MPFTCWPHQNQIQFRRPSNMSFLSQTSAHHILPIGIGYDLLPTRYFFQVNSDRWRLHKKTWIMLHFFLNMTVLKKRSLFNFQLLRLKSNSCYQTKLHGIDIDVSWCIARNTTQKTLFEGTFPHVFITFTPHSISTKWLNSVCELFGLDTHLKFNIYIAPEKVPSKKEK